MYRLNQALEATFDSLIDVLENGGNVRFLGFGEFTLQERAPRTGRNASTGAPIPIPAKVVPVFKPAQRMLNAALKNTPKGNYKKKG